MDQYYEVAVNFPLKKSILTYRWDGEGEFPAPGRLVKVPLGRRNEKGCIISLIKNEASIFEKFNKSKIKGFKETISEFDSIQEKDLELYKWMAQYYHYSLGQLIFDTLPKALKKPRVLNQYNNQEDCQSLELSPEQKKVSESIKKELFNGFSKWLVHGITGSGKTFIYLSLIKEILAAGKSVLFLLPEINLSPQFLQFFSSFLNAPIYSYNSAISNSDKYGLYKEAQNLDRPIVVIGVRSAIFLPIKNLGLIVVDEEHDQSFKQDDRCPYQTRDVAMKKGALYKIPVVLGSATPSMESFQHFFEDNPENYFHLDTRMNKSKLPEIEVVDLREKRPEEDQVYWPLHKNSVLEIEMSLKKGEQVLVFINRLGFASFVQCGSCGHQFECKNCSTTLRYFKNKNILSCHQCEYLEKLPPGCPHCNCLTLVHKGFGTERVMHKLEELFPNYVVERFDRDEITTFKKLEQKLNRFHQGEIDLLVGTQMLSKGHNFKKVNLVVILGIDSQLNFPDFRSAEKAFALLNQVSGRAGRFSDQAKVVIQSLLPENELFLQLKNHQNQIFYQQEIQLRKELSYPPFEKVVVIYLNGRFQDRVIKVAKDMGNLFHQLVEEHFAQVKIMGPSPTFIEKRANQFTWQFLLKSGQINQLHNLISTMESNFKFPSGVSYKVDVDPVTML